MKISEQFEVEERNGMMWFTVRFGSGAVTAALREEDVATLAAVLDKWLPKPATQKTSA